MAHAKIKLSERRAKARAADAYDDARKAAGYTREVRRACAPPPGRYYSDLTVEIRDVRGAYMADHEDGHAEGSVIPSRTVMVQYVVHVPGVRNDRPEEFEIPLRTWLREGWYGRD